MSFVHIPASPAVGKTSDPAREHRELSLASWFEPDRSDRLVAAIHGLRRVARVLPEGELLVDRFAGPGLACVFFTAMPTDRACLRLRIDGSYQAASCGASGWLLTPICEGRPAYWLPQLPRLRVLNDQGHILTEVNARLSGWVPGDQWLSLEFALDRQARLDTVLWRLPPQDPDLWEGLTRPLILETQGCFLWGSHTTCRHPADIYHHLVHGSVYENRYAWPHRRKICSENDAHALYVMLSGLERATGKRVYDYLKRQVLLSVLARQNEDGGWRHGEWSESMEAHFRLNASAIHLFMDALEECEDPAVRAALVRAVNYLSRQKDELDAGTWFLHDELELTEVAMSRAPFRWQKTKALGKSVSNMLVLNTHLDTTIALDRYGSISGDQTYKTVVASARAAARAVLALRPAEWLYRAIFRAIALTFLPSTQAARLPLVVRAVKRLAWKYLVPNLHRVKSRFPRFVMPGGYVDRAIPLKSWAFHYLSVNIMDLLRYQRRFPEDGLQDVIKRAIDFTHSSGVLGRWAELSYERYALGFWAEALYHACTQSDEVQYRDWLAQAVVLLDDAQMGVPPSLLGANCEAVPLAYQQACPSPDDPRLRIVNLSTARGREFMVVNTAQVDISTEIASRCGRGLALRWETAHGQPLTGPSPTIPARGWIRATEKPGVT